MTISVTTIRSGPYTTNGLTNNFPFTFQALSADEVRVFRLSADGVETDIVTGWTAYLNPDKTGYVGFPNAPGGGDPLYIESDPDFTQAITFSNQGPYLPASHEAGFDRSAARDLYLRAKLGTGGGGSGGGGSVAWGNITSKPSTFPPSAHTHVMSDITDLEPAWAPVSDTGTGAEQSIDIPQGGLTVLDVDVTVNGIWQDTTQYSIVAASVVLTAPAGAAIQVRKRGVVAGGGTGGGGGGGDVPFLVLTTDFGGVGNDTFDNAAAFVAAEAATPLGIYLPEGTYYTTSARTALTKRYRGPGKIRFADTLFAPGRFSYMASKPTAWPTQGITGWFRGDQRFTDGGEYNVIGPNVREYDVASKYFESTTIPHHAWFDINSGNSGMICRLTSPVTPGQNVAQTDGVYAELAGKQITLADANGTPSETLTVLSVNVGTGQITFTTNATLTHPVGGFVRTSLRTWNGHTYVKVASTGGGDNYGHIVRGTMAYVRKPGQKHYFETATFGQYGGEVYITQDANYCTGWESQFWDQNPALPGGSADVAVIGSVNSYIRGKDTGAYSCVWLHDMAKSEGSKLADAGWVLIGGWRLGLDTSRANLASTDKLVDPVSIGATAIKVSQVQTFMVGDTIYLFNAADVLTETKVITSISRASSTVGFAVPTANAYAAGLRVQTATGGAAVQLKLGQRIVFNGDASDAPGVRGGSPEYGSTFGNVPGDIIMRTWNDGSSDIWEVAFNRDGLAAGRLRLRPGVGGGNPIMAWNGQLNLSSGINVNSGNVSVAGVVSGAGGLAALNGSVLLGGGFEIYSDGTNIRATKNSRVSSVILH